MSKNLFEFTVSFKVKQGQNEIPNECQTKGLWFRHGKNVRIFWVSVVVDRSMLEILTRKKVSLEGFGKCKIQSNNLNFNEIYLCNSQYMTN